MSEHRIARGAAWSVAAAVAGLQVYAAFSRPLSDRLSDLDVYVGSVAALRHGGSLYDFVGYNNAPFTYPPLAGMVFFPLGYLDEGALRLLWTAATLVTVAVIATMAARRSELPAAVWPPAVATVLLVCAPVSSDIRFGQVSLFLALAVLVDILGPVPERARGILTGLAAAIKLTPLIFVPFLWFAGRRRQAVLAAATFTLGGALAWLVLPGDSVRFWLTEVSNVERVGHIATTGNQSLNGALLRLEMPERTRLVVAALAAVVVVSLALWRARRAARSGHWFAAVIMVGAAGIVVSPVSWTHHQIWLMLAALLAVGGSRLWNFTWAGAVAGVMILPIVSLAGFLPGPVGTLAENTRLVLAIGIACVVPFRDLSATPAEAAAPDRALVAGRDHTRSAPGVVEARA